MGASTARESGVEMCAADTALVEKTLLKPMSLLLKQLERLTSATLTGSAKMMSTHFGNS
jgi:hypothetical protein